VGKRVKFESTLLPYLLLFPQVLIVFLFFILPGFQAVVLSFFREDAFGLSRQFVGFENFAFLFNDPKYLASITTTIYFSVLVMTATLSLSLYLAVMADRAIKGSNFYTTMIIWPYAVAPVVSGVMWMFLFNPIVGVVSYFLEQIGYEWNHTLNSGQAFALVVVAATWRQISYNFLFFLAGMQGIPPSLIESAAIDGAKPFTRFWKIVFPLLSPITFFLIVMNVMYTFFQTFGIIHQVTGGGPQQATNILVYKVYSDGFVGLNLGSSSAQSVILMIIVIVVTILQFRFLESRVEY
jgi:sn-glycerol 3-phosphate transport system permease protein